MACFSIIIIMVELIQWLVCNRHDMFYVVSSIFVILKVSCLIFAVVGNVLENCHFIKQILDKCCFIQKMFLNLCEPRLSLRVCSAASVGDPGAVVG